jgi:hypothetical protein
VIVISADNAYAIYEQDGVWCVSHVFMSPFDDDCQYLKNTEPDSRHSSEEDAVLWAYNREKEEIYDSGFSTEYGIFHAKIPSEPCGRCWVCINERKIIDDELDRCDECGEPLLGWQVWTAAGKFHRACEPSEKK